ncbi:anti-repressor SinI family protein [Paenibacillus ihumii]|uniref:anti-repressor SinI family protein n=1 Tax=Paenibacillus ihumii TaxID=687436 RepID=UPI000A9CF965|nr:anti-repressor SinI family protein [Paenibacillus ihumii]
MMNKPIQTMAGRRSASSDEAEWMHLLAMAKEAGIPIEEVRSFLRGRSAPGTGQAACPKIFASRSIQEEEEETLPIALRDDIFRRNL